MIKSYTRMVHVIFVCNFSLSHMNGYTFLTLILPNRSLGPIKKKGCYISFGTPGILQVARPHDGSEWNRYGNKNKYSLGERIGKVQYYCLYCGEL